MILEPGKLTAVRTRFSILFVILLATYACIGGPTSDTPSIGPGSEHVDAGLSRPGDDAEDPPGAGASADAGNAAGELDAASPATDVCGRFDAGDAGEVDGGVDGSVDGHVNAGDASPDADSATDAAPANDAQVDTDASFPDAAGDAQPLLSDGASDAPHTTPAGDACVP